MILFNEQEMELIWKEFTFKNVDRYNRNNRMQENSFRTRNSELNSEAFTERPIDDTDWDDLKNVSTKSVILAPFNSTKSHLSSLHSSVLDLVEQKSIILWFGPKVKEIDH